MDWLRWYHGAISDSKWPIIARKSGQNIGVVVSVWAALLEHASQDDERGSVAGFDPEAIDALFGYDDGTCEAVVSAMTEKKLIVDGCIASWTKRQPKREREDEKSTVRVQEYRARKRQKDQEIQDETPCNASETPCNASETPVKHQETPVKHQETPREEKNREEKNREEEEKDRKSARARTHTRVDHATEPDPPKKKPAAKKVEPDKRQFGECGNVKLTRPELEKLNEQYGVDATRDAITFLDQHIGAKGKDPYASHYLALKKWVFTAVEEKRRRTEGHSHGPGTGQARVITGDKVLDANIATAEVVLRSRAEGRLENGQVF